MQVEQTASDFEQSISQAEEILTEREASKRADKEFLGEVASAEIIDVEPSPYDGVVEFTLNLPNYKTATLTFSEYECEDGRVETFLDNIDCTPSDMIEAAYHSVPVTYTYYKGWIAVYGERRKHLNSTYKMRSNWYVIDEKSGQPKPNWKYSTFLISPLFVGVIATFLMWSVVPFVSGVAISFLLWALNFMYTGISMPNLKPISLDGE